MPKLFIASAALLLAACVDQKKIDEASICSMIPDRGPMTLLPEGCIHAWAYRLAKSSDPVPQVVDAVMGACHGVMSKAIEAQRLPTVPGHFQELLNQRYPDWKREAQFRVVQARAGNCETTKVP